MSGISRSYSLGAFWDPFRIIGDNTAAFIECSRLSDKITILVRSIFVGVFSFYCCCQLPWMMLREAVLFSTGISLFFIFFDIIMCGHAIRSAQVMND